MATACVKARRALSQIVRAGIPFEERQAVEVLDDEVVRRFAGGFSSQGRASCGWPASDSSQPFPARACGCAGSCARAAWKCSRGGRPERRIEAHEEAAEAGERFGAGEVAPGDLQRLARLHGDGPHVEKVLAT